MKTSAQLLFILIFFLISQNLFSQLIWSTYIGSERDEEIVSIKVDNSHNSYITGTTYSSKYPTTLGAYKYSYCDTCNDDPVKNFEVFVTKIDSLGAEIIFSTFIGNAMSLELTLDKFGNSYIVGSTTSVFFPVTSNAYQKKIAGWSQRSVFLGCTDAFITKLNPTGTALIFSTYLGGDDIDFGYSIAIDSFLNTFITGRALSVNFPITPGSYDTVHKGRNGDPVFVSKMVNTCSNLIYSTFIGGNSPRDEITSISTDKNGNAYISGETFSIDFPTAPDSFDTSFNGSPNISDIFITKLNNTGSSLIYSTFVGGNNNDFSNSIAVDNEGKAYITGFTSSDKYPVTSGAYDTSLNSFNYSDVILTKIDSLGKKLIYSTFLGGIGYDEGSCVSFDNDKNIYITGYTSSVDFPTTHKCLDSIYNGGGVDYFVAKLKYDGTFLLYSTYLGGSGYDKDSNRYFWDYWPKTNAIDNFDNIYIAGSTKSIDFPTTYGVFDSKNNGGQDGFITKLDPCGGRANIQAVNEMKFPVGGICNYNYIMQDTIFIKNNGDCKLYIHGLSLTGLDSSYFSVISNNNFLINLKSGDSVPIVVVFSPGTDFDEKSGYLNIFNSTSNSPYVINLSGKKDSIAYTVNNKSSDTIIIDLGTYCPGDAIKDTTITIFNKSSIGTTLQIENVDPGLQLNVIDKAVKKEGEELKRKK